MKKFCIVFALVSLASWAAPKESPKIPHNHSAQEGGHVYMIGDDHLEAKLVKEKLSLYFSDKFRKASASSEFEFEVYTQKENQKLPLKVQAESKTPFALHVELSKNFSHDEKIYVTLKRKNPPKGYVVSSNPASFTLMDLH